MKRDAFTIMEVIISIIIVSVVGIGVMGSGSNYAKLMGHIEKNSFDFEILSFVGINGTKELHNTTRNLEDIASKRYFIKNDKVIDYLKTIEFSYQEKEPEPILMARQTDPLEWSKEQKEMSQLQFGITQISVKGEALSGILFTIREMKP